MELSQAPTRRGYFRWVICGLLFLAATVNYIDRQVIGILKPTLQHEFGWTETDYANIVFAFQLAYAVGFGDSGTVQADSGRKPVGAVARSKHSICERRRVIAARIC